MQWVTLNPKPLYKKINFNVLRTGGKVPISVVMDLQFLKLSFEFVYYERMTYPKILKPFT